MTILCLITYLLVIVYTSAMALTLWPHDSAHEVLGFKLLFVGHDVLALSMPVIFMLVSGTARSMLAIAVSRRERFSALTYTSEYV